MLLLYLEIFVSQFPSQANITAGYMYYLLFLNSKPMILKISLLTTGTAEAFVLFINNNNRLFQKNLPYKMLNTFSIKLNNNLEIRLLRKLNDFDII